MTPLVVCVGNPYRRDDGVGLAVLDSLPDGTRAVEATGEPTELLNLWSGEDLVVLVDAMSTGAAPGTVHTLTCRSGHWDAEPPAAAASTHGLGVAEAIGLGAALGSVPQQVVLVGVEVSDTGNGVGLTDAVSAALPGALAAVTGAMQGGR